MKSITFTGGLGAQIISASAYLYLKKKSTPVRANFDYFDIAKKISIYDSLGIKYTKTVDFFPWQLDDLGISQSDFKADGAELEIVTDGPQKHELSIAGFADPEIREVFKIPATSVTARTQLFADEPYTCIHIRRGDYLRVASYLIDEHAFYEALCSVSKLTANVLLLSDSNLSESFVDKINGLRLNIKFLRGGSPGLAHGLMRLSRILICSNSQYSYTAAFLREQTSLTLLPSRHEADENSEFNKFLRSMSAFQLFTGLK